MIHKIIFNSLLCLYYCALQGFESHPTIKTIYIMPYSSLPSPSIEFVHTQPVPQKSNYSPILCATTTCGCAACCCIGPMNIPIFCELARTGALFVIAALAGKNGKRTIVITAHSFHTPDARSKK